MTLFGLAVAGLILGAAGMQFLRSSKPEMVDKVEDGIKSVLNSIHLPKSDNKKAKEK
jgi:hypothetical protein